LNELHTTLHSVSDGQAFIPFESQWTETQHSSLPYQKMGMQTIIHSKTFWSILIINYAALWMAIFI